MALTKARLLKHDLHFHGKYRCAVRISLAPGQRASADNSLDNIAWVFDLQTFGTPSANTLQEDGHGRACWHLLLAIASAVSLSLLVLVGLCAVKRSGGKNGNDHAEAALLPSSSPGALLHSLPIKILNPHAPRSKSMTYVISRTLK